MKYIKPETTKIILELSTIIMVSKQEEGIVGPSEPKGGDGGDGGDGNIVMGKQGIWDFDESDDSEWPTGVREW